jgi:hypothetical protein
MPRVTIRLVLAAAMLQLVVGGGVSARQDAAIDSGATRARRPPADFDFLVGDWEVRLESAGATTRAYWSGWRLRGGELVDEFRRVDSSNRTVSSVVTMRAYNAALARWDLVSATGVQGLANTGTAQRIGAEILVDQRVAGADGPELRRTRIFEIGRFGFSLTSDRSLDDGHEWQRDVERGHATRTGPPHPVLRLLEPPPLIEPPLP